MTPVALADLDRAFDRRCLNETRREIFGGIRMEAGAR
jgi:hypothetical protein